MLLLFPLTRAKGQKFFWKKKEKALLDIVQSLIRQRHHLLVTAISKVFAWHPPSQNTVTWPVALYTQTLLSHVLTCKQWGILDKKAMDELCRLMREGMHKESVGRRKIQIF